MASVGEILTQKASGTVSLGPEDTVLRAAQLMDERGIGSIAIVADGRLVGMFTERDVLRRVVAQRRDPATTKLAEVMTTPVTACGPEATIEECAATMDARHVRHLPVVSADRLLGMISIRDLLAHQVHEQESTIQFMRSYIFDVR
jgi:CBS domain-containing protein